MENIVNTLVEYSGALEELISFIRLEDSGTQALQALETFQRVLLVDSFPSASLKEIEAVSSIPGDWPPNPFTDTLRVSNERFIGREAVLRRLRSALESSSFHLQGEPKIGKSSLLWLLYQNQVKAGAMAVFGDFQHQEMLEIVEEVAEKVGLSPDVGWPTLRRALAAQPFYLFLDEFDLAPQMGFTLEWGRRLRGLAAGNFRLLIGARHTLKEILPHIGGDSPWYNYVTPETLGSLAQVEAEQLFTKRLPVSLAQQLFTPPVRQYLFEISGCHPFKLTRAAYRYYDQQTNEPEADWQIRYYADLKHFGLME
ncbi:MAG: ATP-binding protein [Chloroflexi bacterium]|nr:ATP-binding protein [Chloroflexota bacterium]